MPGQSDCDQCALALLQQRQWLTPVWLPGAQAIKDAVGENTGITSAAPRWLSRTISALEAEDVEVNMTKLDAMEQVRPRRSCPLLSNVSSSAQTRSLWVGQHPRRNMPQPCWSSDASCRQQRRNAQLLLMHQHRRRG